MIPPLDRFSGSWVITNKKTKQVICESFNRDYVAQFDNDTYNIETAYEYLCRINREIKEMIDVNS